MEFWFWSCLEIFVYIWYPSSLLLEDLPLVMTLLSWRSLATCWRPCSWCPSSWLLLSMEVLRWLWRMMMLCCFAWWLGALVDGCLDWIGWCFGGLDDVLVVGGSCAFLLYILPVSWSLPPLRVGSLKPLLVGSKRTLAGPSEELELLFQLELKDLRRLKSSTCQIVSMVFINE